jgi:hypothetical protein
LLQRNNQQQCSLTQNDESDGNKDVDLRCSDAFLLNVVAQYDTPETPQIIAT